MIAARLEWLLPEPVPEPPRFTGFGAPLATLLARRGFRGDDDLQRFLQSGAGTLHDASLMADAERALLRIEEALTGGERIAIWGDYDADGMSAVAVWTVALRRLGAEPRRYVPSRLAEGYGLSVAGLRQLARDGVTLVVTCDCGISNAAEVEEARALGVDVIVTDHHLPPAILPRAVAVVDPHRADCPYPDPDLTGAGIAYKLAASLLAQNGAPVEGLAALAAIGTVADVAPMTGEGRAIVRLGLEEMARSPAPGLRALLARAAERPERPTARDLAFGVVPRVNAAGRIADAEVAIALLVEEGEARAETLAQELERVHAERRALTVTACDEAAALADAEAGDGPLVVRSDGWLPGLVGLIAGRLAEALARPVAAAALVGDEVRGSVRAPSDFHVAAALERCGDFLTKRGGHAAAGGFSAAPDAWDAFSAAFRALPRPFPDSHAPRVRPGRVRVDLVLAARLVDWTLAEQLARLEPYGPGHPEPVLAVTGLRVGDARRTGNGERHLLLRLLRGYETFDAAWFGAPADVPLPTEGMPIDLVGTLERDDWNGMPRLRLRVLDYGSTETSPLVARRARMPAPALAVGG
ncbi:MAG TPA: single-stranded-DNA-specific exonuclease RecJ [Candidatus Limnocylindria bacterium]|nr:single-stranded-DNA-specific exonuclease RecJ [Candidatus Limnocylindria bacterium]